MFSILGILSQVLSQQTGDVFSMYTRTTYDNVILADSPLLYYPLTPASILQYPANIGNIATYSPFTYYSSSNPVLVNNTGNSMVFTAANFIEISKTIDARLNLYQNKSIELWFRYSAQGGGQEVFSQRSTTDADLVQVSISTNWRSASKFTLAKFNGTAWESVHSTTNLAANTRYHAVATWDNSTVRLYLNGTLNTTASFTFASISTGSILIGRPHRTISISTPVLPYSHIAVYDSVLSEERVLAHYNAGIA
jgi:hypothetical protein